MSERLKYNPKCVEVECAMKEQWDEIIERVEQLERLMDSLRSLERSEVCDDG